MHSDRRFPGHDLDAELTEFQEQHRLAPAGIGESGPAEFVECLFDAAAQLGPISRDRAQHIDVLGRQGASIPPQDGVHRALVRGRGRHLQHHRKQALIAGVLGQPAIEQRQRGVQPTARRKLCGGVAGRLRRVRNRPH